MCGRLASAAVRIHHLCKIRTVWNLGGLGQSCAGIGIGRGVPERETPAAVGNVDVHTRETAGSMGHSR